MRARPRRWMRHLRAARRLDGREYLLVAEAAAMLMLARMLIAALPLHAIARRLGGGSIDRPATDATILAASRVLGVTARLMPFRAKCLEQAVAATMMLRRRGMRSTLHLGTTRDDARGFEAHAWITVAGTVVLGGPVSRYVERAHY